MSRTLSVALISVVILSLGTAVASTAFTTATVERDATIDIVTDANGPISIQDGNTGDVVYQAANGEITIDFSNPSGSTGVNPDASYTLGDTANGATTYAFSVTNTDASSHDIDFSYAFTGTDPDAGTTNVAFEVFDSGGVSQGTANEGSSATVTVASGATVYVVVTVDSTGLSSGDTLTGTLTIAA